MTILHPQPMPAPPDALLPPPLPRRRSDHAAADPDPVSAQPLQLPLPDVRYLARTTSDELAAADVAGWLAEWRAWACGGWCSAAARR